MGGQGWGRGQSQVWWEGEKPGAWVSGVRPLWGPVTVSNHPSLPTRLTAFVLKVLSLAQEQVGGSPEKLQETARWLLSQQQADGSFQDLCPVLHRDMQVRGLGGQTEEPRWEGAPCPSRLLADISSTPVN